LFPFDLPRTILYFFLPQDATALASLYALQHEWVVALIYNSNIIVSGIQHKGG
jgi:hypothetical protein